MISGATAGKMNSQRLGSSYATVGGAIIVGAIVIAAAIFSSSYLYQTVTKTEVTTSTSVSTTTATSTSTSVTTETSTSTLTTNLTSTSVSTTNSNSVTYSPASPVAILGVTATTFGGQNGSTDVIFQVRFLNNGTQPLYYVSGCGSGLSSSIISGSSVIKTVPNRILCMCAEFMTQIPPGQNETSGDPGCWSSYAYELVGHGMVVVKMTLGWSSTPTFSGTNSTSIQAVFSF